MTLHTFFQANKIHKPPKTSQGLVESVINSRSSRFSPSHSSPWQEHTTIEYFQGKDSAALSSASDMKLKALHMFQQPGSSLLKDEIEACGSQINEWWSCHIFYPERKCSFVRSAAVTFHWNDIPLSFRESFYILTTEVIVNVSWSGHTKQIRTKW